jgi:hypothetical protein
MWAGVEDCAVRKEKKKKEKKEKGEKASNLFTILVAF